MATAHGGTPPIGETGHGEGDHAAIGTYVKVAVILCVLTALEYAALFIRRLTPILVPLLISMSMAKFALVALFFMHLRYDSRVLAFIFVAALVLATGLGVALVTLNGQFLVFGR
jgi:caa(3)-type oxidase subunit IV